MNVGRLHAVLQEISDTLTGTRTIKLLNRLKTYTEQLTTTATPEAIQNVKNTFDELVQLCASAKVNTATPTQREIYDAVGASGYVGPGLLERIEGILTDTQYTPAVRVQQLQKLIEETTKFLELVNRLLADFKTLHAETDIVDKGEGELGISIPRTAFDPTVRNFEKEFKRVNFVLETFNEIATNNQGPINVKSISSSDWQIYLLCGLNLLVLLPEAIEKILGLLNKYLDYKKKISDLEAGKFPAEAIKPVVEYLEKFVPAERRRIAEELVEQHAKDAEAGRKEELKNKMDIALSYLTAMMGNGTNFEVRAQEPDPPATENPESEEAKQAMLKYEQTKQIVARVNAKGETIRLIRLQEKIEFLPPPDPK